ncbi:hypothetical protein MHYP_G00194820 [Metynnis hypsauchen]
MQYSRAWWRVVAHTPTVTWICPICFGLNLRWLLCRVHPSCNIHQFTNISASLESDTAIRSRRNDACWPENSLREENESSTTALTCVLHCFPCEPSWADRPFLLRSRAVSPATATMTRSKTFQAYLPNCHRTYSCIHCRAHLANHDELISKSFQGSQGRAYLFNSVVNVGCGPAEERVLLTGLHAVADIYCENCKTTLGWKYVSARSHSRSTHTRLACQSIHTRHTAHHTKTPGLRKHALVVLLISVGLQWSRSNVKLGACEIWQQLVVSDTLMQR